MVTSDGVLRRRDIFPYPHSMDAHSVLNRLDEIMGLDSGIHSNSVYYGYYQDEANRLANMASYQYTRLRALLYKLGADLPVRRYKCYAEDEIQGSGILWFDMATACLPSSDVITALLNEEEIYLVVEIDSSLEWHDEITRKKRIGAVMQLPKDKLLMLLFGVCSFISSYMELFCAAETLTGVIDEKDYQHAVNVAKDGSVTLHPSAFL